jgi:hypothetical protein
MIGTHVIVNILTSRLHFLRSMGDSNLHRQGCPNQSFKKPGPRSQSGDRTGISLKKNKKKIKRQKKQSIIYFLTKITLYCFIKKNGWIQNDLDLGLD